MKLFETHCHLDFPDYNKDRDIVIKKSMEKGVRYFINVGIDSETIKKSIDLADKYENIYAAAGYHPNYADKFDAEYLRRQLKNPKVIALGEIGLDYYRNYTAKDVQKEVFAGQLAIAEENSLPVIIHNREADKDCLQLLNNYHLSKVVFHCFAGDLDFARQIWEKGWHISITSTITYKTCKINDVVIECPIDKIMTETDCPFLAPQHIRGKRNDPSSLEYVVKRISELKQMDEKETAEALYSNAYKFFLNP